MNKFVLLYFRPLGGSLQNMGWFERGAKKVLWAVLPVMLFFSMAYGLDDGKDAVTAVLNKGLQKEFVFFTLTIGKVGDDCGNREPYGHKVQPLPTLPRFHAAQKAGIAKITPDSPGFWKVEVLNPNPGFLENLPRMKHEVGKGCDSIPIIISVATKTVVDVAKIQEITSEKSEVTFTWKWKLTDLGEKLVNSLTEQERRELNTYIHPPHDPVNPDPTFNFTDLTTSLTPKSGKKALKKAGDSWVLDE